MQRRIFGCRSAQLAGQTAFARNSGKQTFWRVCPFFRQQTQPSTRRQSPWKGSTLLRVRMQLAAGDPAGAAATAAVSAPDTQSAPNLRWRETLRTRTAAADALGSMIAAIPGLQTSVFLDKPGITQRISKHCAESGATRSCHAARPAIPAPEKQSPQEKKVGRIPYLGFS